MPKTTAEQLNPTRSKLTVSVSHADLEPHLKTAYQTISEQVSIPGFRKGKVPAPIIDQRVGREAVIQEAVNSSLDEFFRLAVEESEIVPMGRPSADVETWIDPKDEDSELVLVFEVEVRPEFDLPEYDGIELTVDNVEITDESVDAQLDRLRESFGTLNTVDRPATSGDFVELDLVAMIEGTEVDQASGVSYEVGSGNLLDGIDEAIDTLTAGESTTFNSVLLGGEHEGQEAEVTVTLTAVKERELAEANDEFAQLASEFDTLEELRQSIREELAQTQSFTQGNQARELLLETLIEKAQIPVSQELVDEEVHRHLENENRLDDDEHRAEVQESSAKQLQTQLLLDALIAAENVEPTQEEISRYIVNSAAQYGMEPQQFIQALMQSGQIQIVVNEVTRNKALIVALSKAKVTDADGNPVDLTEFTAINVEEVPAEQPEAADAEASSDEQA